MTLPLDSADLAAIWLTLKLASLTTLVLLLIGTPLAWWLARTRARSKAVVEAVKDLVVLILHPFQIFLRISSAILVEVVPLEDLVIEEMT